MKKFILLHCLCALYASAATYDITSFGASTSSEPKINAKAIQAAIDKAHNEGGGEVYIPEGTFISGTIWLKSNVSLKLSSGARLKASPNLSDYNKENAYPENWHSKAEYWNGCHFIIARHAHNSSIYGPGIIDGNGDAFFEEHPRAYYSWMKSTSKIWWNGIRWAKDKTNLRPGQLVVFIKSNNVIVDGITIKNSPCWSMFLWGCKDIKVTNYTVRNGADDGNTDGIDFDCCENVLLENADIDTGDDGVAIRASSRSKATHGGKLGAPRITDNVRVKNCKISCTSSVVRIGVGDGIIQNVVIENVKVINRGGKAATIATAFGSPQNKGTDISNVTFKSCDFTSCRGGPEITSNGGTELKFGIRKILFENCTFGKNKPIISSYRGVEFPVDPKEILIK